MKNRMWYLLSTFSLYYYYVFFFCVWLWWSQECPMFTINLPDHIVFVFVLTCGCMHDHHKCLSESPQRQETCWKVCCMDLRETHENHVDINKHEKQDHGTHPEGGHVYLYIQRSYLCWLLDDQGMCSSTVGALAGSPASKSVSRIQSSNLPHVPSLQWLPWIPRKELVGGRSDTNNTPSAVMAELVTAPPLAEIMIITLTASLYLLPLWVDK